MWRIIQNAVATKENLFVGKCSHSPFCPICELEVESVEHVCFHCDWAVKVWNLCVLRHLCSNVVLVARWVESVLFAEGSKVLALCASIC